MILYPTRNGKFVAPDCRRLSDFLRPRVEQVFEFWTPICMSRLKLSIAGRPYLTVFSKDLPKSYTVVKSFCEPFDSFFPFS